MKYIFFSITALLSSFIMSVPLLVPQQAFAADCAQITQAPNMYQATQTASSAALFFTPVNETTTGYTINYGYSSGDDRFNVDFASGNSDGAITYTVGGLDPTTHYFFRARAKNDCSTGPYGNWFEAVNPTATDSGTTSIQGGATTGSGSAVVTSAPVIQTPVTGVSSVLMMAGLSLGLTGIGAVLFFGSGNKRISF